MDPGLLRYHPELGWTLTPNWRGRHRHHDFDVGYSINAEGFRGWFPPIDGARRRVAVLGDSFTFGLGVEDGETFVSRLNEIDPGTVYLNFGVPGYSTDQELQLLDPQVFRESPDSVWLAFYLGNDILDNALDYPLQADQAKPMFELLDDGSLQLRNVPVPRDSKPAVARLRSIEEIVFGTALKSRRTVVDRVRDSSHLFGRLLPRATVEDDDSLEAILRARLDKHARLLSALLGKLSAELGARGVDLLVVPLPGQSLVEQPRSAAGVFQAYILDLLAAETARSDIVFVDPLDALRAACGTSHRCFYPNEGHYTAMAHTEIATFLVDQKRERAALGRPF
jgi:hypothetical protein